MRHNQRGLSCHLLCDNDRTADLTAEEMARGDATELPDGDAAPDGDDGDDGER